MNRIKAGGPPPQDITPPPEWWATHETDNLTDAAIDFAITLALHAGAVVLLAFLVGLALGWVK